MSAKSDRFISAYKELEDVVGTAGMDGIYSFEQSLDQTLQKKMQLCRLTRNFLQHENDAFIEPSAEMTEFVKKMTKEALARTQKAKDAMKRVTPLNCSIKVKEAAGKTVKSPSGVPVVDDEGTLLGIFDSFSVCRAVESGISAIKPEILSQDYGTCAPDIPYDKVCGQHLIVTQDGSKHGKYKGVLS